MSNVMRTMEKYLQRKFEQAGADVDPYYIQGLTAKMYQHYTTWVMEGYSSNDALEMSERLIAEKIHFPNLDLFAEDHFNRNYKREGHVTQQYRHNSSYESTGHYADEFQYYQTERQAPGGSRYYQTETRRPGGSSKSKERRYGGKSYARSDYTHTAGPEPQRRPRGQYQTEERRPKASPHEPYYTEARRSYSSSRSHYYAEEKHHPHTSSHSSFRTEARRPRASTHSYSYPPQSPPPRFRAHSPPHQRRRAYSPPPPTGEVPKTCFYKVLGVPRNASTEEIKKAYRKLSMKWHPDRVQGEGKEAATQKMMEINYANDVLSDEAKRDVYDRTGRI